MPDAQKVSPVLASKRQKFFKIFCVFGVFAAKAAGFLG